MEKIKKHIISEVIPGGIGEEMEIEAGDKLLKINNEEIKDIFDYRFLINDDYLEVLIEKADGEVWELEIEKDFEEDLGLEFENGLMDDYKSCGNKCIFCFIDQLPKGMRNTLYFKDDDSRLSFLQGNYVTLTNMKEDDIDRIIRYRMEPINISFQTMNKELRCKMLNNKRAGEALDKVKRFVDAEIAMNGQIVLCKGVNDGKELEYSLEELLKYCPVLQSVSIVPVGLTKYREGLYELEPFNKEDAVNLIRLVEKYQKKALEMGYNHFVHASDEWYLLAGEDIPKEETYDGYLQLENGVGMIRLLCEEFEKALEEIKKNQAAFAVTRSVSIATGKLAYPIIRDMAKRLGELTGANVKVYEITNEFFGERITVNGLICGQDLIKHLKGKDLGEELIIAANMLKRDEAVFLDDVTTDELSRALQVDINIVKSSGQNFTEAVLGRLIFDE